MQHIRTSHRDSPNQVSMTKLMRNVLAKDVKVVDARHPNTHPSHQGHATKPQRNVTESWTGKSFEIMIKHILPITTLRTARHDHIVGEVIKKRKIAEILHLVTARYWEALDD